MFTIHRPGVHGGEAAAVFGVAGLAASDTDLQGLSLPRDDRAEGRLYGHPAVRVRRLLRERKHQYVYTALITSRELTLPMYKQSVFMGQLIPLF